MKVLKWLDDNFEEKLMSVALWAIVIIMGIQVIMRYVFKAFLTWSEEVSRYLFVLMVFIGMSYGIKNGSHMRIDMLEHFIPKLKKPLGILADVCFLAFAFYMIGPGINVFKSIVASGQTSPAATIFDTLFVFENLEYGRAVLNDPSFMAAIAKEYDSAGFKYLAAAGQGFRTLTSNKKVTNMADLKGLTIRTMENKYHLKTWSLLCANPTPLTFNELYTALQQGTVDAQENPIELVVSQKFYEQQKYIMNTNHIMQD